MSFYTTTPMTEDQLRSFAPSVFATTRHQSRTEKFQPIATIEVIRALADEGFGVFSAKQSSTRDASRRPFTRHLLRLRPIDDIEAYTVGDCVAEVVLRNANDGSSQYELFAGIHRIRCLNGLVASIAESERIQVRHNARELNAKVIEGTARVIENSKIMLETPKRWGAIEMDHKTVQEFGEAARAIRFGDEPGSAFTADQMVTPRRDVDRQNDLWTVFNVAQENSLRGGLSAMRQASAHTGRHIFRERLFHSRDITAVDRDVSLNIALWALGEEFFTKLSPAVALETV